MKRSRLTDASISRSERPGEGSPPMVRAEIIAIGSELVLGGVADTNSLYLAEELLKLGIEVRYKTVVGDDSKDMEAALQHALGRADVVITTGGLGPTEDDLTRKVVARVTGRRLG